MNTHKLTRAALSCLCAWLSLSALARAETAVCHYLAHDGFQAGEVPVLHQRTGGTGWERAWEVQGSKTALPGYQVEAAPLLGFGSLVVQGGVALGGRDYVTAGRKLDVSSGGPFTDYLAGGTLALNGKTLWFSGLLRKDQNNDTPVWMALHDDNLAWYVHNPRLNLGFMGNPSKAGGIRYWSMQINDTVYRSSVPVTVGQPVLLAAAVTFDSVNGHTVQFFVNPADLGADQPPAPVLTQTVTGTLRFRSVGLYLGSAPGNGAVDEIRLADAWRCATPTPEAAIDAPPTARINVTVVDNPDQKRPLTVTLDGSASSDAEGPVSGFEWSFDDGSPGVTGVERVTHTYTDLGLLRPSLTVTDSAGQKSTHQVTVTVRDEQGTFPCLSTVSMVQRPSCGQADGKFQVSPPTGATYTLLDQHNRIVPAATGHVFQNLAPGDYRLTVTGAASCSDQFKLYVREDPTTCPGWTPPADTFDLGMNLDGVNYYSRERAFRDYMKSAGTWLTFNASGSSPWNTGMLAEMPVDADGYPTQVPFPSSLGPQAVRGIISADRHMPPGDYVLLYQGTGKIEPITVTSVLAQPGKVRFTIQPTNLGNIWFNLTESRVEDPVRNIRIYRANEMDADGNLLNIASQGGFNAGFLERLRPFKAIRFLNWSGANPAQTLDIWERDRTRPTRYSQAGATGVAVEHMVELGNLLHKDIWLTVPHTVSDAYAIEMARFFHDNLNEDLRVYLEFSNEVWNTMFSQSRWVDTHGPGTLNSPRKYAERAVHLYQLWHGVYGQDRQRVKRVFNVQAVNPWYGAEALSHARPEDYDYISPDAYFGYGGACEKTLDALGAAATSTQVLDCVRQTYQSRLPSVRQNYLNASLFGKEIINYEGGQAITTLGQERSFQAAIYGAQIDPEIATLYQKSFDDLRWMGSRMSMIYQLAGRRESKYGSWGHLEDIDLPTELIREQAPKYQILLDNLPPATP